MQTMQKKPGAAAAEWKFIEIFPIFEHKKTRILFPILFYTIEKFIDRKQKTHTPSAKWVCVEALVRSATTSAAVISLNSFVCVHACSCAVFHYCNDGLFIRNFHIDKAHTHTNKHCVIKCSIHFFHCIFPLLNYCSPTYCVCDCSSLSLPLTHIVWVGERERALLCAFW